MIHMHASVTCFRIQSADSMVLSASFKPFCRCGFPARASSTIKLAKLRFVRGAVLGGRRGATLSDFVRIGCAPFAIQFADLVGFFSSTLPRTFKPNGPCLLGIGAPPCGSPLSSRFEVPESVGSAPLKASLVGALYALAISVSKRVAAMLACSASVDANARRDPRGTRSTALNARHAAAIAGEAFCPAAMLALTTVVALLSAVERFLSGHFNNIAAGARTRNTASVRSCST
jgi:hypothetical protein